MCMFLELTQLPLILNTAPRRVQLMDICLLHYYTVPIGDILRKHNMLYHMYADNIQIFDPKIPLDAECALFQLSACAKDIQQWMVDNKLKLNEDKTKFIIISSTTESSSFLLKTQLFHLPNLCEI